jgi:hypothetical protein
VSVKEPSAAKKIAAFGVAAAIAGAVACLQGLAFVLGVFFFHNIPAAVVSLYPVIVIIAVVLGIQAGIAKSHRLGVLGGLLTLVPLLVVLALSAASLR